MPDRPKRSPESDRPKRSHPVRTAVIGTSWWADGVHLPGLRVHPEVELLALCGRNVDRLAATASKFGIARTFTDYRQMLERVRPELVVVSTPNHEHAPMTLAALEAGAHVICEKPLGQTAAEAARMLECAERLGRRHLTFLTYRGMAGPRFVKRLIESGHLGRLYHAQASYLHASWHDPGRLATWKTRLAGAGGGVLGDLGSHVIDMLQWWLGPVTRAVGAQATFVSERPTSDGARVPVATDDATAFVLELASGGHATVQLSRVAAQRHNYQRIELYGSAGMLVYEYDQPLAHVGRVFGAQAGVEVMQLAIPPELSAGLAGPDTFPALYRVLTDPFFASLNLSGPAAAPSFVEGLAVQEVIDAVARSFVSGRWERVPGS